MKSIFEVGCPVWDEINYPNTQGVITEIGNSKTPIEVKFGSSINYYTKEGAIEVGRTATLSKKPYKFSPKGFKGAVAICEYQPYVRPTISFDARMFDFKIQDNCSRR